MTAPVIDISTAIQDAVSAAVPAPAPEPVAAPVEDTETDAPATKAPAEPDEDAPLADEEEALGADASVELPEGYVAVPAVTEGLATDFVLRDEHGEVEIPALIVEYKANGKVRQDRLDQVVKLAQWGVYNQDREQKLQTEVQQKVAEYEELLAEREQQMERLLNDDSFLDAVREAYLTENSPERRAERAEAEKEALRVQYQMQSITASGEQFYNAEVAPALEMIVKALPTVTAEELESKLQMAMQAHVEVAPNGVPFVPPSRYDAIRQYIVEDLALWAQASHMRRAQPAQVTKASAELERAQVEAQKAKRMVGQKLKPVGQVGATSDRPKASPKPSTVDDAVNSALSAVLSSIS